MTIPKDYYFLKFRSGKVRYFSKQKEFEDYCNTHSLDELVQAMYVSKA